MRDMVSLPEADSTTNRFDVEEWRAFSDAIEATAEMVGILETDFQTIIKNGTFTYTAVECRVIVRAFGSLMDGISTSIGSIAVAAARLFNRPLNAFLQQKVVDRVTSTYQRMFSNYRLVGEFLPGSPFAQVPDDRWDNVHAAIEIRNRVVHPNSAADLKVSEQELNLIMELGLSFSLDFRRFFIWFNQKGQKFLWQHVSQRRRLAPKVGRNAPCPCGSQVNTSNAAASLNTLEFDGETIRT